MAGQGAIRQKSPSVRRSVRPMTGQLSTVAWTRTGLSATVGHWVVVQSPATSTGAYVRCGVPFAMAARKILVFRALPAPNSTKDAGDSSATQAETGDLRSSVSVRVG